jgi:tetratricopeptide (TPR) repeat protein
MRILLLLCLFCSLAARAQQEPYNAAQVTQWLQQGAWDEVINAARATQYPDSFLLQSAGYASYQSGDRAAASDYFNRLLALDSNQQQALYYTAVIAKTDEHCNEAIPLLERLCRKVPAIAQYHVLLADCYSTADKRAAAIAQLQMARDLAPNSLVISNKLANAFMRQKTWDSAEHTLAQAMKLHPRDPLLIGTAINLAYTRKDYEQTSAWTDSLIQTHKLRHELLLIGLYADVASRNQEHTILLGDLLMLLGQETEDVLYYTANAHKELRHWQTADSLMQKCISKVMKPNLEAYYLELAEIAAATKDWSRSMAYYDTAYYLFKHPYTLYLKGIALTHAGKKTEAKQAYKRYLALPLAMQDTAISHYLQRILEERTN